MILASGGLSHWVRPVSEDDPRTSPDIRDYTIGGRHHAREYSAMRDASVRERQTAGVESRVNEAWDRGFLAMMEAGELDAIAASPSDWIEAEAGNGAHEIRGWLAGLGAYGRPVSTLSYEPVTQWATGMACAAAA